MVVYLPKEKVLVSGDLVTAGLPFPRDSYPAEWVKTLRALAELDFVQVIPGHGPVEQGKDQVSLVAAVFESIVAQVRDAVAKGLSLDDTEKAVNVQSFRERVAATTQPPMTPAAFKARVDGVVERAYLEAKGELKD